MTPNGSHTLLYSSAPAVQAQSCVVLTWSGRTDAKGCQAYPEIFASCWDRVGSPQAWLNARSEVGLELQPA